MRRGEGDAIAKALEYPWPAFLISGAHAGTSGSDEAVMRFLETSEAPGAWATCRARGTRQTPKGRSRQKASGQRRRRVVKRSGKPSPEKVPRQEAKSVRRPNRSQPNNKKPALGGFFGSGHPKGRSLVRLLQRLDAGGQGALVAARLVAMDHVLVDQRVDIGWASLSAAMASALLPEASASLTLRSASACASAARRCGCGWSQLDGRLSQPTWYWPRKISRIRAFEGRVVC
jgi:hypothetical protein